MKTLVTGGTGFTGSNLAWKLCEIGDEVRLLVRDKAKTTVRNGLNAEIVQGDIRDFAAVDRAVRGVERVFHLAAVYRTAGISDSVYRDVHLNGTENLLKASLKHGVNKFIHCSTVGVHGHIDTPPANETYRFKPGDIYQRTKLEGELRATEFAKETGLPVVVVRPCAIYGPGDMRLYKLFQLSSKKVVFTLGSGSIFYHMVYIDDLIQAFLLASENDRAIGEAFIIGGAEVLTLNAIIDLIAELLKNASFKVHLPAKPFQALATLVERIYIPLGLEPPIYRRRIDFFTKSRAFDVSKANQILGFEPSVNIREGLSRTATWYIKQGLL
jgi:nucleoside-diphosphate-sugar epimerase